MSESKKSVPIWVLLVVCAVIIGGAFLVSVLASGGKGPGEPGNTTAATEGTKAAATDGGMSIKITDGKATELLRKLLPSDFPISDMRIVFYDGEIRAYGTAEVDEILQQGVLAEYPELAMIRAVIPARVEAGVGFKPSAGEDGFELVPEYFSLAGYSVPVGFLPRELKTAVSASILRAAGRAGFEITGMEIGDGSATITAK